MAQEKEGSRSLVFRNSKRKSVTLGDISPSSSIFTVVNRRISKAIRWLLRLDQMILDQLVDEYLLKNRTALDRKRREWFETRLSEQVENHSG